MNCTCAGCPPKPWKILRHAWQDIKWASERTYEPCADQPGCCGCPRPATQEDLLCDECREIGGVSMLDERRVLACLAPVAEPRTS